MTRHLIVKLNSIGDVVETAPAVESFKAAFPGAIDWLCGATAAPIVKTFPFVDRVLTAPDVHLFQGSVFQKAGAFLETWKKVSEHRYSTCAVLHSDWRFRLLTLPVRCQRRVSMGIGDRRRAFVRGRARADEYRRILLGLPEAGAERVTPFDLVLPFPQRFAVREDMPLIAIAPGGAINLQRSDLQRRWPIGHYVALAERLISAGCQVALVGGPTDKPLAENFHTLPVLNTMGAMRLDELAGFFRRCDVVVTHDAGPLHIAALANVPIVALFGPTNPREVAPNRPNLSVIWGGEDLACRPCYDGRNMAPCAFPPCMASISPQAVFDSVIQRLTAATRSPALPLAGN